MCDFAGKDYWQGSPAHNLTPAKAKTAPHPAVTNKQHKNLRSSGYISRLPASRPQHTPCFNGFLHKQNPPLPQQKKEQRRRSALLISTALVYTDPSSLSVILLSIKTARSLWGSSLFLHSIAEQQQNSRIAGCRKQSVLFSGLPKTGIQPQWRESKASSAQSRAARPTLQVAVKSAWPSSLAHLAVCKDPP